MMKIFITKKIATNATVEKREAEVVEILSLGYVIEKLGYMLGSFFLKCMIEIAI